MYINALHGFGAGPQLRADLQAGHSSCHVSSVMNAVWKYPCSRKGPPYRDGRPISLTVFSVRSCTRPRAGVATVTSERVNIGRGVACRAGDARPSHAAFNRAGQHVTCINAILHLAVWLNEWIASCVGCNTTSHPFFAK